MHLSNPNPKYPNLNTSCFESLFQIQPKVYLTLFSQYICLFLYTTYLFYFFIFRGNHFLICSAYNQTEMPSHYLTVDSLGNFRDKHDRVVVLRGINLDSASKMPESLPSTFIPPEQTDSFWDGDNVSFVNRPFALEHAHKHFQRIKDWGFNTIRYIYTWEALEHKGP